MRKIEETPTVIGHVLSDLTELELYELFDDIVDARGTGTFRDDSPIHRLVQEFPNESGQNVEDIRHTVADGVLFEIARRANNKFVLRCGGIVS